MKKKNKYSLTSKQRKQKRIGQEKNPAAGMTPEQQEAADAAQAVKKAKRKKLTAIIAIVMACVLGATAITAGVVLIVNYASGNGIDNNETNPIAVITLSTGQTIEYELYFKDEKDPKAAVANFIYLAENKFYDNTIFHNSANKFLAMSGFTSPTNHRAYDEDYIAKLKGFSDARNSTWGQPDFKLGYRLSANSSYGGTSTASRRGYLGFASGTNSTMGSSTSYFLVGDNSALLNYETATSTSTLSLTYMGYIKSGMDVVISVLNMDNVALPYPNVSNWRYPREYANVMIKTVRIKNLNTKLKKNILKHFEEYVIDRNSEMDGAMKGNSYSYDRAWEKTTDGYTDISLRA